MEDEESEGGNFDSALTMLAEAGFDEVSVFEKRQPTAIKIEEARRSLAVNRVHLRHRRGEEGGDFSFPEGRGFDRRHCLAQDPLHDFPVDVREAKITA